MYVAALCELRMEEASRLKSEKLDDTQRKLDLFYKKMDLVKKYQDLGGVSGGSKVNVGGSSGRHERKKGEWGGGSGGGMGATPVLDIEGSGMEARPDRMKQDDEHDLELELDRALSMESRPDTSEADSNDSTRPTRSNFRLVLKPLPLDDASSDDTSSSHDNACTSSKVQEFIGQKQCPHTTMLFQCPWGFGRCGSSDELKECEVGVTGSDVTGSNVELEHESELLVFEHIEHDFKPLPETPHSHGNPETPQRVLSYKQYPRDYHSLEFLPYNPLPDQLEAAIFPKRRHAPLPLYHDPYWPRKGECLELVAEMKGNPHVVSYLGTFITPEARGAR